MNHSNPFLSALKRALLSSYQDNIVYRHEIRMDTFGRLSPRSPIIAVHVLMAALVGAACLSFLLTGWDGLFKTSGTIIGAMAFVSFPLAYRRAFLPLRYERTSGALEQLYMTSLTHQELFEGKFLGALAPFFEARRYLAVLCGAFTLSAWFATTGPAWLVAASVSLVAINHFGYSAYMGVMTGLRAGARSSRPRFSLFGDWDLNPWPHHLWLNIKYCIPFLVALGVLSLFGGSATYPAYVLLVLVPILVAGDLRDREQLARERLARAFHRIFNFEPGA